MSDLRFRVRSVAGVTLFDNLPIDSGILLKLLTPRPLKRWAIGEGAWCHGHANERLYVERVR